MTPVLLDTDLGSDPDDELALALLWGSPELRLDAVCTTYGDTAVRAAIVTRMASLTGRAVRVGTGAARPRSGAPVWWAGREGEAYGPLPEQDSPDGVAMLLEHAEGARLLAIGPLGSVADAFDAGIARHLRDVVMMGGDWSDGSAAEHNVASDVDAARRVLTSGTTVTVCGVDVTRRVRLSADDVGLIGGAGALGAVLATELTAWMRRWDEPFDVPHDALTALLLVEPELFTVDPPRAAQIADGTDGRPAGAVRLLDEPGAVRVVRDVDADAARRSILARVLRGLTPAGRDAA